MIFGALTLFSYISYTLLTYKFVRIVKKDSEAFFSSVSAFTALNWIWRIILLYAILHIIEPLVRNMLGHSPILYYKPAIHLFFGYILSIYAFRQPLLQLKEQVDLLQNANSDLGLNSQNDNNADYNEYSDAVQQVITVEPTIISSNERTSNSRGELHQSLKEVYITTVEKLMNEDRIFLDLDLRISDLAEKASIPIHLLSQLINEHYENNFFNFVNGYRIEYAESILKSKEYSHLTISAIALEAGFNSKSTFNTLFKKKYGTTPSAYKKQHLTK
jgi:AraC-like DNA-binding protein